VTGQSSLLPENATGLHLGEKNAPTATVLQTMRSMAGHGTWTSTIVLKVFTIPLSVSLGVGCHAQWYKTVNPVMVRGAQFSSAPGVAAFLGHEPEIARLFQGRFYIFQTGLVPEDLVAVRHCVRLD
jgi:hypothetical protein